MRKGDRRGILFCAVVGVESAVERTYLRFVPAASDWKPVSKTSTIEAELRTCLRLLECGPNMPTWYPEQLRQGVYDFWALAQEDIWHDWMRETDPANVQPPVRPLNHGVAKFIRDNRPFGSSDERMNRALDILESPWPRGEESMLGEWFKSGDAKPAVRVSSLIDRILETGLEPTEPPPLLPPIDREEVELVCWMGIERDA